MNVSVTSAFSLSLKVKVVPIGSRRERPNRVRRRVAGSRQRRADWRSVVIIGSGAARRRLAGL